MDHRHGKRRRGIFPARSSARSRSVRIDVVVVVVVVIVVGIGMLAAAVVGNQSHNNDGGATTTGTVFGIAAVDGFSVSLSGSLSLSRRGGTFPRIRPTERTAGWLFLSATQQNNDNDNDNDTEEKKKKKKKSRRLVINPNLNRDLFAGGGVATITSDGVVKVAPPDPSASGRTSSKLGVPTKPSRKKQDSNRSNKRLSAKAEKLRNQRTAGGTINSNSSQTSRSASPADEDVRIATAKRGSKTVTMVQGMAAASNDERKRLLKKLKAKVGGGGTVVEGVLEIQGSHAETVRSVLVAEGYAKARNTRMLPRNHANENATATATANNNNNNTNGGFLCPMRGVYTTPPPDLRRFASSRGTSHPIRSRRIPSHPIRSHPVASPIRRNDATDSKRRIRRRGYCVPDEQRERGTAECQEHDSFIVGSNVVEV
eukprot:jgi/Psemu1/22527/gm1.22527_g